MPISPQLREELKQIVLGGFERMVNDRLDPDDVMERVASLNNVWFQLTLPGVDTLEAVFRPMKISMGSVMEDVAKRIAEASHPQAIPNHELVNYLNPATSEFIASRVDELRNRRANPDPAHDIAEILQRQNSRAADAQETSHRVDLFVIDASGISHYIEIKGGAQHDRGKAAGMKSEALQTLALANSPDARYKVGASYNAYGENEEFRWSNMLRFFVLNNDLLVGREFWNFIGANSNTYRDLRSIFTEIGTQFEDTARRLANSVLELIPQTRLRITLTGNDDEDET